MSLDRTATPPESARSCPVCGESMGYMGREPRQIIMRHDRENDVTIIRDNYWWCCEPCTIREVIPSDKSVPYAEWREGVRNWIVEVWDIVQPVDSMTPRQVADLACDYGVRL